MNKKIIFIGGTSRSGSTLLDLIIANDKSGVSLGEISSIFWPSRKHHFELRETLLKDKMWAPILSDNLTNLYKNIFKFFPDKTFVVDSSKDPFWINFHSKANTIYDTKNVLIHKTPFELAHSFTKRGKRVEWINNYIKYHRLYFTMIPFFSTIAYKDLILNESSLRKICDYLGIAYFNSKMDYWERKHVTFFGSNSTRSENSFASNEQLYNSKRRDLTYDYNVSSELENFVFQILSKNIYLKKISKTLQSLVGEVSTEHDFQDIKYSNINLNYLKLKKKIKRSYRFLFPEDYFSKYV